MSRRTVADGDLAPIPGVSVRDVSLDDLVRWTAAVGDFSPIHYDPGHASARGFAGPVVNGPWKSALVMEVLGRWAGEGGCVEALECRYEHADIVGDTLEIGARVTRTEDDGSDVVAECEVWIDNAEGTRSLTGSARVRLASPPEEADGLPLARLREVLQVGEVSGKFTYRVEPNEVARFRAAVAGADHVDRVVLPAVGDIAPPTFYAALDPVERRDLDPERTLFASIPFAMSGGGNAFNEVVYERPIRAGDVVTVTTRYSEVYVKNGRSGTLLFRVRTNDLLDGDGDRIGSTRMGHVLAFERVDAP